MLLKQYTAQNTLGIAGISKQLCAEAVKMGFLQKVEINEIDIDRNSLVHLFLHPEALKRLLRVTNQLDGANGQSLVISTMYRTLAQQYILKRNLTTLVAPVGRSDHYGMALDIVNYSKYYQLLVRCGFKQTYGDRDPVHFDCNGIGDYRSKTILAFQRLWNRNNSSKLDEDGVAGSGVLMALSNTPVNGFINAESPRYMSLGDSGKDVGNAQFKLRDLGFLSGSCDGLFGNQTQAAVIQAQIKFGLNPTGIISTSFHDRLFS